MSDILVSREGPVTVITLNRPARRNAINGATAQALREAMQAFDADGEARVAVVTGGDSVFCAGADLKELTSLANDDPAGPLGFTRMTVSKPTIAAIAGYAVAGGLELACWCDLRIADESAVFGCFERRFGVPLIDGGTQRLPRLIGLGRALDLILTGREVAAWEAYQMGLVTQVVAQGTHRERAVQLGQHLAAFPQVCLNNDRRAVYEGLGEPLARGLEIEASYGHATLASGEASQGAEAFKRGKGRGGEP